jgi:hypothetical protein
MAFSNAEIGMVCSTGPGMPTPNRKWRRLIVARGSSRYKTPDQNLV